MKFISREKLILSLIKDDLINSKLVNGLTDLGLNADNYHVHLGDTVFRLMGFKEGKKNDELYERYLELSKRARFIDIAESDKTLDDLAFEIYLELSAEIK